MTSGDSKLLMLGLSGSGKTTYLAALWHLLESAEVRDRLQLPHLQPDRDYLNSIRSNWLSVKPVPRTPLRAHTRVSLNLVDRLTNSPISIELPDLSGESFHAQWATRKATREYTDMAEMCTGVFLFVHPSQVTQTHAIKPQRAEGQIVAHPGPAGAPSLNWSPTLSSTQVQLVDLLQLLIGMRSSPKRLSVSVVISAWDTLKIPFAPEGWLESRLPLLAQYLAANRGWLLSSVHGVSAQGGDLERDRDKLLNTAQPSDRSFAISGNTLDRVSISAPLQFLLDGA